MNGAALHLGIGERVAFYRRRRGLTQEAIAGLVGRTASWLEKIESGRAPLDRISVVRELARALNVAFHDLVADDDGPARMLREHPRLDAGLSYRALNPRFAMADGDVAHIGPAELRRHVDEVWTAYQDSRWSYVLMRLDQVLPAAYAAAQTDDPHRTAARAMAHLYHLAASVLVKIGRLGDAWVCAERGDIEARAIADPLVVLSLQRAVAHSLLSSGRYADAVTVVRDGLIEAPSVETRACLSVIGTLMLVGATASARAGERLEAMAFLRQAEKLAERVGRDANDIWTSFGPTNVAIHRVTVEADLGDLYRAVNLGQSLDVGAMPRERRVRHQLEMSRAFLNVGGREESLLLLLEAERSAPEQTSRHFLTRDLVDVLIRTARTRPDPELVALARRLGHPA